MQAANDLSTGNRTRVRQRTLVLRGAAQTTPGLRGIGFLAGLIDAISNVPARLKPLGIWLMQPRVALVLAILAGGSLGLTTYYYNALASEIDARLQSSSLDNSVGIFSSPFEVSAGDRLPIDQLAAYLQTAGYQQRSAGIGENIVGSFETTGDEIEVVPGDSIVAAGVYPVRIRVDKNARVVSLTNPINGERLQSARIEGGLLATVRDGDRRKKIAIQFSDVPEVLRNAIVAAEDRRFFMFVIRPTAEPQMAGPPGRESRRNSSGRLV